MERRAVEESLLVQVRRTVLRAHRVIRAQAPQIQCTLEVTTNVLAHVDEPPERPLGPGRARIQKDSVARLTCIDALSNRARLRPDGLVRMADAFLAGLRPDTGSTAARRGPTTSSSYAHDTIASCTKAASA